MIWLDFNGSFYDFIAQNKNDPGTIIEVDFNNKKKHLLIGDVSIFGSVMNGDCLLNNETFIYRYKRLWHR